VQSFEPKGMKEYGVEVPVIKPQRSIILFIATSDVRTPGIHLPAHRPLLMRHGSHWSQTGGEGLHPGPGPDLASQRPKQFTRLLGQVAAQDRVEGAVKIRGAGLVSKCAERLETRGFPTWSARFHSAQH